ncbi:hypothetical protein [Vibrio agarivorans]|uniref:Uncharacterized protein n=1 Tax=Vibrio agarivorans TaxID=153622 RepID=A0ABT7Y0Z0_9VIBR|nr:hypothetical protein [Vibrio agarivorans]MDN2481651.1 hypothetical protein [Vibrio agarivorans]
MKTELRTQDALSQLKGLQDHYKRLTENSLNRGNVTKARIHSEQATAVGNAIHELQLLAAQ